MPDDDAPATRSPAAMTTDAARRAAAALAGALAGPLVAGALSGALHAPMDRAGGAAREAALFAPLAIPLACALVPVALLLSKRRADTVADALAGTPARARAVMALAVIAPPALVVWIGLVARAGRFFITAFHHVGLAALAQAVFLAVLTVATLATVALAARILSRAIPVSHADGRGVLFASAVGAVLAGLLVAYGVRAGDMQGVGGLLGGFGVLKKPELDLSPVYGGLGALALAGIVVAASGSRLWLAAPLLVVAAAADFALLRHGAAHFADAPSAAVIEARPGIARTVLRVLRRRADRDRDGASRAWGGGDCDDNDPRRNPDARDVPGNGIDEDCSGRDAPAPPPLAPPPPASVARRAERELPADMNLVLITVDTLRWDLHYAGNPREISPNLDRLARESVVMEHGYALSSYTGRAIGPMLTGRYPTECPRDNSHFTQYPAANVFLAERLAARGFRTMGAASHFYFQQRFGLAQGMSRWDMSAEPSSGEQETTSTDARVADRAIAMLQDPANRTGRFFLWTHFFDPHKLYVAHPEVPSFGNNERARYEGEVAWTDRQVGRLLDALAQQPFADRTIVVVTSDHGEAFAEHGMSWHGIELWQELVRVPWLVRVPGIAPRRISVPRSQIDLVPTLLELLRIPAPPQDAPDALSGVSLVPDFLGEALPPRPVYIELPEGPFNSMRRSVIADGWKLTERGARRFELYNLERDPGERTNLAQSAPEDLARMRLVMEQVRSRLHPVAAPEARPRE